MDCVKFKVNGVECSVGNDVSSTTSLLEYLRRHLELRGTKYMCLEGGCGACIVSAVKCPGQAPQSVNACLVSVTSCQGWDITTIEQVGNRLKGYHPLQTTLAEYNGTQCGFCTPGWVMSMYSLLKSEPNLTMLDVERSLSSNLCRCTGYRPIFDAFKKFASDAAGRIELPDIEELCKNTKDTCLGRDCKDYDWCFVSNNDLEDSILYIELKDGRQWFRVQTVADILQVLRTKGVDSYMLVAGNTGKGAYPIIENPRILIDISGVSEIRGFNFDQNLVVGAGSTLSEFIQILQEASDTENFEYLKIINEHIQFVAHVAVRNIGTIAGNLMIKHAHREFPSDIFLLLETIGARLTIISVDGTKKIVTMANFLAEDMKGKVILNVLMPPFSKENKVVTYKVAARSRNAHAIVNAGFFYKIKPDNRVADCRIVYGDLSPNFNRASKTEKFLVGKILFNNDTLQKAMKMLSDELIVTELPPEPSAKYRRKLALVLFYKGLLSLCPENILNPRYRSGAIKLPETRPVSTASQSFTTDPTVWPINQPLPKAEALLQCAGEAKYTEDIPKLPNEVFAAFVLSTVALGTITSIDATEALQQEGVIAFYIAKDIPGLNSFTSPDLTEFTVNEEILCSKEVQYYNQPIGIIVADTFHLADRATLMVKVTYSNVRKPEVDIRINKKNPQKTTLFSSVPATRIGNEVTKTIRGSHTTLWQYHFCFETIMCVSFPTEEELKVHPTSQYIDASQFHAARCLNIEESRVDVEVRRLGGSFGLKLSRQTMVSTACALVAYKLNRPCRFILPLRTQTRTLGKRMPSSTDYEIGVNENGVIQYLNFDLYDDNGFIVNEPLIGLTLDVFSNCYNQEAWTYRSFNVITDTHSNTWIRSPGTLEAISSSEEMMERISYELGIDPLQVRLNNLDRTKYSDLEEMVNTLIADSNYKERRISVNQFNVENRWKKRGLRFTLLKWSSTAPFFLNITMSVFHGDGSVAIVHGGTEMGQGINTKAIQVCAFFLKVPLNKIFIKPNTAMLNPNNSRAAGSMTSQNVQIGVQRCCEQLLTRLNPIKKTMTNPTWEELIAKAFQQGVNLQANAFTDASDVHNFDVYGVTLAEVEVDVLTGQFQITRVDLLEDVGRSVNPDIDIGQVEGAFIMGVGYFTSEETIFDRKTGELLTDRTWNYFVPGGTDIPQDLRIYFRKKSYSNDAILGSKLTSEPATCMGVVIPFALREAITSSRLESGFPSKNWFNIDGPYTVEKIGLACETKLEEFKFY
ncbi:xanthine dehydrogenase/oxidase-like [Maniola hyperantus]|uniref:xanthine dehydrogenase/oxidase-like n=1 Tax=Aphantopus hyperantus TaxID=2795564 RepID=UPI0037494CD5